MIKHIVMWKLKETAAGRTKAENALLLQEKLEALPAKIAEIKHAEVGINFDESDAAFDIVLCAEFESVAALRAYQAHPEHQRLIHDFLNEVRIEKRVVDYEQEVSA